MPCGIYKRTIEHNKNIGKAVTGYKHTEKSKEKMSDSKLKLHKNNPDIGKKHSKIMKEKYAKGILVPPNKGKSKENYEPMKRTSKALIGIKLKEEHCKNISKGCSGIKRTPESIQKQIENCKRGKNHPDWIEDRSLLVYPDKFNLELKEQIRKRDNYRCQQCFRHQDELFDSRGKKYDLSIHHIDYNKKNSNPENLISLCKVCHGQTNFGRDDWSNYFQNQITRSLQ